MEHKYIYNNDYYVPNSVHIGLFTYNNLIKETELFILPIKILRSKAFNKLPRGVAILPLCHATALAVSVSICTPRWRVLYKQSVMAKSYVQRPKKEPRK